MFDNKTNYFFKLKRKLIEKKFILIFFLNSKLSIFKSKISLLKSPLIRGQFKNRSDIVLGEKRFSKFHNHIF